jgi:hypothetical protein
MSRVFLSIFLSIVPGQFSHERSKSSPFPQCLDPLLVSCKDVFISIALAMYLLF